MKRREFITLLGGAAVAWPLAVRAQQADKMRRIGVILPAAANDAEFQTWVGAFLQALAQLGWIIGNNVRIDIRWATANAADIRRHAAELAALAPDVILASGTSTVGPMLQATRTVPVVFPTVVDPVGAGFVDSLARPGGNATGFLLYEIQPGREMAGAAQADRAGRDASGASSRPRLTLRDRPVWRYPGRGAVARGGD
jgi:putative ABC transport system substrate-binding protein